MKLEEVCHFLHFTTGSSVCVGELQVSFNSLSGSNWPHMFEPVGMSCQYLTYEEFAREFRAVIYCEDV